MDVLAIKPEDLKGMTPAQLQEVQSAALEKAHNTSGADETVHSHCSGLMEAAVREELELEGLNPDTPYMEYQGQGDKEEEEVKAHHQRETDRINADLKDFYEGGHFEQFIALSNTAKGHQYELDESNKTALDGLVSKIKSGEMKSNAFVSAEAGLEMRNEE